MEEPFEIHRRNDPISFSIFGNSNVNIYKNFIRKFFRLRHNRRFAIVIQETCLEPKRELPKPSPTNRNQKASNVFDGTVKSAKNNVVMKTDSNAMSSPKPMSVKCSSSAKTQPAMSPTTLANSWATFYNSCGPHTARKELMQTTFTLPSISPIKIMSI